MLNSARRADLVAGGLLTGQGWGTMENSDWGVFNRDDWNQPRGHDSGPISPSLPLALDKLHEGDTGGVAWLPLKGSMGCHLKAP